MPRYQMLCDACGHEFEAERPMSEGPPRECAKCHQDRVRQVYGPVAIVANNRYSPMHPRRNRGRGY